MITRRTTVLSLSIILCLVFPFLSWANAGPSHWEGYPSGGVLAVDSNTPIVVKEENLTIDFSFNDRPESNEFFLKDFSPIGQVRAEYSMYNSSDKAQAVQMAFPFVSRLDNLRHNQNSITIEEQVLEYEIYDAGLAKGSDFDFSSILKNISTSSYEAKNFTGNELGKLYVFELGGGGSDNEEYEIEFEFDPAQTRIIAKGFHGFQRKEEGVIRNTVWCGEGARPELLVLGRDISIKEGKIKASISTAEKDIKSYIMDFIEKEGLSEKGLSEDQNYNIYSRALDKQLERNLSYAADHDLVDLKTWDRIFVMVYTVEFSPEAVQKLSASYYISGTMDRRKTRKPTFSYDYIWNPAAGWKDFQNLNLTIITPQESPYIIYSSVELVDEGNNKYTATLETLPYEDLNFVMYEKASTVNYARYVIKIGLVAVLVIWFVIRKKRKQSRNQPSL